MTHWLHLNIYSIFAIWLRCSEQQTGLSKTWLIGRSVESPYENHHVNDLQLAQCTDDTTTRQENAKEDEDSALVTINHLVIPLETVKGVLG